MVKPGYKYRNSPHNPVSATFRHARLAAGSRLRFGPLPIREPSPPAPSWPGLAGHPRLLLGIPDRTRPGLKGPGLACPGSRSSNLRLLEFDLRASLFELGLDLLGLVLRDTFLDGLRRAFDQVLGFLQPKAGQRADLLDDLDLLVAGSRQHHG